MAFTIQPLRFAEDRAVLSVSRTLRRLRPDAHVKTEDLIREIDEGRSLILGGTRGCGKTSLLNEICFRVNRPPHRVLALGPLSLQRIITSGFDSLGLQLRSWVVNVPNVLPPQLRWASVGGYPETLGDWVTFLRGTFKQSEPRSLLLLIDDLDWVANANREVILSGVREFLARITPHASLVCAGNLFEGEMDYSSFADGERYVLPPFQSEEMDSFLAEVERDFGYQMDLSGQHEVYWWTRSVPYFVQALMLSLVAAEISPRTTITAKIVNDAAERIPSGLINHFAQPLTLLEGVPRDDAQEFIRMLIRSGSWGVDWDHSLVRNLRRWGLVRPDALDWMVWATPMLAKWFDEAGPEFNRIEDLRWETKGLQELEDRASALRLSHWREAGDIPRKPTGEGTQEKTEKQFTLIVDEKTLGQLAVSVSLGLASGRRDYGELQLEKEAAANLLNALVVSLGSAPAPKKGGGGLIPLFPDEDIDRRLIDRGGRIDRSTSEGTRAKPKRARKLLKGTVAPSRYVNFWFTKDQAEKSHIEKTWALKRNEEVYLRINIGPFDVRTIMNREEAPEFPSTDKLEKAFPETKGKPLPLEATIFSNDFDIPETERTRKFKLRSGYPTDPLYFPVKPRRKDLARLRLCIFYRNHLLQSFSVATPVRAQLQKSLIPQTAEVEVTFSADFTGVRNLPPRGLWLGLNQNDDDTHTLNIKNNKQALSRNMEDKIEKALLMAREALLKVSFDPLTDYSGKVVTDENGQPKKAYRFDTDNVPRASSEEGRIKRFRQDLTILASAGSSLYRAIFGEIVTAEKREEARRDVYEMKATLRDEQIIQVARLKKMEDIWPWALMYDSVIDADRVREVCLAYRGPDGKALPYADGVKLCQHRNPKTLRNRDKTVVCPYGFWGFKHIIEQPTQPGGVKAFTDLVFEIKIQPEPVLQMLLEKGLGEVESLHIETMRGLKFKTLSTVQEFTNGLDPDSEPPGPEPHVVYFFCHGKYDSHKNAYLEVGTKEALLPSELDELDFSWTNSHGLVFINGCHTAELLPKDLSSIMQPFVKAYASGIIGTEISVATHLAREFGQAFFNRFLAKKDIQERVGQIIKDLRLSLLMKYNPLGLVYTPYCSADLHVTY